MGRRARAEVDGGLYHENRRIEGLTPGLVSPGVGLNGVRLRFGFPDSSRLAGALLDYVGIQTLNGAAAIVIGNEIYFRSKADYNPDSINGIGLIGHEITHVAQEQSGRFGNVQYAREYFELR